MGTFSRAWRTGGIVLALALAVLAAGLTPAGASAAAEPKGTVTQVGGATLLTGVACSTTSTCIAVGQAGAQQTGVIVTITDGKPGAVQQIAGTNELYSVACSDATECVAVGVGSDASLGVVVPISHGHPGAAQTVSQTAYLHGVACSGGTACVAVGWQIGNNFNGGRIGVVVPVINGRASAVEDISGTLDLDAVDCSGSACVSVGTGAGTGPGITAAVVPISTGTAGGAQSVSGVTTLQGVACASASSCTAVGPGTKGGGVAVAIKDGAPGASTQTPDGASLWAVACPTSATCWAGGTSGRSTAGGFTEVSAGAPGSMQPDGNIVRIYGIDCTSDTACVGVGQGPPLGGGPSIVAIPVLTVGAVHGPTESDISQKRQDEATIEARIALFWAVVYCGTNLVSKTTEGLSDAMQLAEIAGVATLAANRAAFEALEKAVIFTIEQDSAASFGGFDDACVAYVHQFALAYVRSKHDPPDTRYTAVALPETSTVRAPASCTDLKGEASTTCARIVARALALGQARSDVDAIQRVLATATDRLLTARAAGATAGVELQTAAIAALMSELVPAVTKQDAAGVALAHELAADGVSMKVKPATLQRGLPDVVRRAAAQDVPADEVNALLPSGFTDTPLDYAKALQQPTPTSTASEIASSITSQGVQALRSALAGDLAREGASGPAHTLLAAASSRLAKGAAASPTPSSKSKSSGGASPVVPLVIGLLVIGAIAVGLIAFRRQRREGANGRRSS